MDSKILLKYLNNQCSPAELEEVYRWAKEEALDETQREQFLEDWKNSVSEEELSDERFYHLFDQINERINSEMSSSKEITTSGISVFTRWLVRAAAILLLPTLIFLSYTINEKKEISHEMALIGHDSLEVVAPLGSRIMVQLSDGSTVHLNSGSKLKYPQLFRGDKREVRLTGEGFFEVAHNPLKPFIVKSGILDVKAVGTIFNVFAYPQEKSIETTLLEGKVILEQSMSNTTLGVMQPGEHVKYDIEDGTISSTEGNIERYVSWKDGLLVFEDTPIVEVAGRLEKMFNVDIEISESIKDYNYTVTIIDEPLFQILDLMTMATPVKYSVQPRKKKPDGTYTRQKIKLTRRN